MLTIQLPEDLEEQLCRLAREAGQNETEYVLNVLFEHLGDLEDNAVAVHRLQNPEGRTWTLDELEQRLDLER